MRYVDARRRGRRLQLRVLRAMTPDDRLRQCLALSALVRDLFVHGLRKRFPHLEEKAFQELVRSRLERCCNRNW